MHLFSFVLVLLFVYYMNGLLTLWLLAKQSIAVDRCTLLTISNCYDHLHLGGGCVQLDGTPKRSSLLAGCAVRA